MGCSVRGRRACHPLLPPRPPAWSPASLCQGRRHKLQLLNTKLTEERHGKLCTMSFSVEIKRVFLEFCTNLTQQYPAYFPDTIFGAEQDLSVQVGLLKTHSRLTFSSKAVGQETVACAGDLLHVALCWAEGDTTGCQQCLGIGSVRSCSACIHCSLRAFFFGGVAGRSCILAKDFSD